MLIWVFVSVSAAIAMAAEPAPFSKTVYPIFEEAGCRGCHNADGVASATRLQFPEQSDPPDRIEAFGKSLVVLVDSKDPANSLLLKKPTARIPHSGGQRIQPGSPEEAALRTWIDYLAQLKGDELAKAMHYRDAEASGTGAARPRIMLRRLTHSQYNNTVRDLLGDRSLPANQFPPEDFVNGFKNQYMAQNLSPLLEDAYSAAAEKLARAAFRPGNAHNPVTCSPSAACRATFIQSFGLHAFRRPLTAVERSRYEALFQKQADFATGAQIVVEAMLQSPHFLFHLEDTTDPKSRPYAAASRLSYALWDSMPDEALLSAAGRGELDTPDGVARAARRMLDDPKAHQALDEFVAQWLRFDRVLTATKERRAFPQFTPDTALAMTQEARRFVSDLVWDNRDFTGIFTAAEGYPNGDLARIYGVEPPANDFDRVPFPANSERAGLLGQTLFLTLTAKPDETSPTARGLFVREQFLCQHVADPPPGVNTNLPPVTEAQPMTNRDRMADARHQQGLRRLPHPGRPHRLRLREIRCHRTAARQAQTDLRAKLRRKQRTAAENFHGGTGSRYQRPGRRDSQFRLRFAQGTRRGACRQFAVPGMRREAVFPLRRRQNRNARRPAADPPGLRGLPALRLPLPGNDNLNDAGKGNARGRRFSHRRRGECRR